MKMTFDKSKGIGAYYGTEKAIKEEHASWKEAIDKGYSEGNEVKVERARGAMFALEGLAEKLGLKYN